ncbi:hypothetical protein [Shimwellia blattae]|uniref:Uncharacterized protein n=1 Tax=Shimwellia blattae (strain ATCC 29907 / DSM 4481 / JCM 1650 / NBRC 105725 / CDC 9005-74) TaxID=630626 RepID=I2B9U1_SHIBC|nr:hypothetical protein [Shimwellia blattae]AFJ47295.1 hypothetical protein EBL_c22040 [Shimwellia blattae DSM 4481 = NBRC 105725]GAB80512.1 hypothetical protein EB105725_05_02400 [Shimwellia blattae DSM 4481 = NBRC 105725]VDY64786.1 Uncharacterised protein [Shimwellia blattae]VEC22885.1 Uncharacterised protein [Shimwellia blattae]
MQEKISCVFPFARIGEKAAGITPVLTFDCEKLPVKATLNIAFYFICLKKDVTYTLWFDITRDGVSIIDNSWDREKIFKAEDPSSKPDELAVGLNANMPQIPFTDEGIYTIEAKLFNMKNKTLIETHQSYFKVKLKIGVE